MSLDPNAVPSANFDLSDWKLQLPIDVKGTFSGKAAEVKSLGDYTHADFFYTGADGAMVLSAPVEGATTGGSKYARSELREMMGTANAEWTLEQGGHMSATLQVDAAPLHIDGSFGKVVVGQIHGGDGQMVRLAWEDGTLFFANDITSNGKKDVHIELLDSSGQQPSVSLNETFSYSIDVSNDFLTVSVLADGQVYTSSTTINDAWNDNSFYFKAGAYLGVNETNGQGIGQVSIFSIDVDHSGVANASPVQTDPTVSPSSIEKPDAANLALLYEAALNRQADAAGLNYWIDQFENGSSLTSISDLFFDSKEFRNSVGDVDELSDDAFIDVLYHNVLGRSGEAAGFGYWTDRLASGDSRESVLANFAVSDENHANSSYVQDLHQDSSGNWVFG